MKWAASTLTDQCNISALRMLWIFGCATIMRIQIENSTYLCQSALNLMIVTLSMLFYAFFFTFFSLSLSRSNVRWKWATLRKVEKCILRNAIVSRNSNKQCLERKICSIRRLKYLRGECTIASKWHKYRYREDESREEREKEQEEHLLLSWSLSLSSFIFVSSVRANNGVGHLRNAYSAVPKPNERAREEKCVHRFKLNENEWRRVAEQKKSKAKKKKKMNGETNKPAIENYYYFPFLSRAFIRIHRFNILVNSELGKKRNEWAAQTRSLGSCFIHRLILCHLHGKQFSISDMEMRYNSPFIKLTSNICSFAPSGQVVVRSSGRIHDDRCHRHIRRTTPRPSFNHRRDD